MRNSSYLIYMVAAICCNLTSSTIARNAERASWPLFIYNFGGLDAYTEEEQVDMLQGYGYDGMTISIEKVDRLGAFDRYMKAAERVDGFKIYSTFYRFSYDEKSGFDLGWKKVVDRLAGTQVDLWLIFGKQRDAYTPEVVEQQIRMVVEYAASKNVKVTLYPHSRDAIPTAEVALVYLEKINSPNLDLAVHTCHEIRAGNADRIEEVLEQVKDHLGYVTIAGSDNVPYMPKGREWERSTLKPLYRGNFDMKRVLKKLKNMGYEGSIGFINHAINEAPEFYLPLSKSTYDQWLSELQVDPEQPLDAPDQVVWHAPSRSWFVSNLGGGISLAKDGYGWITRLDEDGLVLDLVWLGIEEKMHAPSGMVITDDYLYVCDRDGVYKLDINARKVEAFYPIPQGEFINDIALAENGDLYVSDFFANRIYRLPVDTRKVEVWLESDRLEAPDGLYIDDDVLVVASWGILSEPGTFNTSKLGDVLKIDLKTKAITVLAREAGNLEGMTKGGGYYYITDWAAGKLLKVHPESGDVTEVMKGLRNPTDPGWSEELGTIAFPQHSTDQVLFIKPNL